jgi:hypothetical protein
MKILDTTMWKMAWLLGTQVLAGFGWETCGSTGHRAQLGLDLQRWFHTGCVFLVNSGTLTSERSAVEANKLFSKSGTRAANLKGASLNNVSRAFKCNDNRPLYVMLSDDENTMDVIRNMGEVGNVV